MVEDLELLKILELRYCFSLVNWNFTHKKPSRAEKVYRNTLKIEIEKRSLSVEKKLLKCIMTNLWSASILRI